MSSQSRRPRPPTFINNRRYELRKKIGAGCFGEVYRAFDKETGEDVAVKLESRSTSAPQLVHGAEILRVLASPTLPQGFTRLYFFGTEGDYSCMVLDLLGKTLEDRMVDCGGRFDVRTTVLVAQQVLTRIQYMHSKRLLHRDIKPENFLFGTGTRIHHLYLIDFGLSRRYFEKTHEACKSKCSLVGTARYASINAHRGVLQSRRDDLESIGHMLMYFLRGSLPWSGLNANTKAEKYRRIKDKKEQVPLGELCATFPEEFQTYLQSCRSLEHKERPNYTYYHGLFSRLREHNKITEDWAFQWFDNDKEALDRKNLVLVDPFGPLQQPDDLGQAASCFSGICRKICPCLCAGDKPQSASKKGQ